MSAFDHVWGDAGGPAFPVEVSGGPGTGSIEYKGMSLRDYFAAKALAGMLADSQVSIGGNYTKGIAKSAYELADAMLVEREK